MAAMSNQAAPFLAARVAPSTARPSVETVRRKGHSGHRGLPAAENRSEWQRPADTGEAEQGCGHRIVAVHGERGAEHGGAGYPGQRGGRPGLAGKPAGLIQHTQGQHGRQEQPGTRREPEHDGRLDRLAD
jgi:hypothetical protein